MTQAGEGVEAVPADPITALTDEIRILNGQIGDLTKKRNRDRVVLICAIVALCFDLIITPIIGIGTIKAFDAASNVTVQAAANRAALHAACVASDKYKADDLKRWNFFIALELSLVPPSALTPQLLQATAQLRAENAKTDKQVNCNVTAPVGAKTATTGLFG